MIRRFNLLWRLMETVNCEVQVIPHPTPHCSCIAVLEGETPRLYGKHL